MAVYEGFLLPAWKALVVRGPANSPLDSSPAPGAAVPSWLRNKRGSYANPIIVEGLGKPASIIFRTYLSVENCRQAPLLLVGQAGGTPCLPAPCGGPGALLPLHPAAELPGPALQPPSPLPGSYLYLLNFSILHPGNADGDHPFHAHNCTGLLLRNLVIKGVRTARAPILPAREAAKARAAGAGVRFLLKRSTRNSGTPCLRNVLQALPPMHVPC